MKNDIQLLEKEFIRIRKMGLVEALREGPTGLGYTFESLLNKKEDQECKPDFGSVEIKCKLGYTQTPLTIFNSAPIRNGEYATRYILDRYGYNHPTLNVKMFSRSVFSHYSRCVNGYEFKLKVNYLDTRVYVEAYFNGEFLENVCYWEFKMLETKLKCKISTLALIYGYPYVYNNIKYYKYLKMEIYKLRNFDTFLRMIQQDKIHICFYMKDGTSILGNPEMETHGVAFKIKLQHLAELFYKYGKTI